jgi:hypothetical protein
LLAAQLVEQRLGDIALNRAPHCRAGGGGGRGAKMLCCSSLSMLQSLPLGMPRSMPASPLRSLPASLRMQASLTPTRRGECVCDALPLRRLPLRLLVLPQPLPQPRHAAAGQQAVSPLLSQLQGRKEGNNKQAEAVN